MSAPDNKPALTSVIRGDGVCLGFLRKTAIGIQAFSPAEILVGVYPDESDAINALFRPNTAKKPR